MTNTTTTTKQEVINIINSMNDAELITLNNEYCIEIGDTDSEIWTNDEEFLAIFFEGNLDGLARAIHYGEYNYREDYVKFNGYGNLETFDYFSKNDLCELVDTIAEYICENRINFSQFDEIDFNK